MPQTLIVDQLVGEFVGHALELARQAAFRYPWLADDFASDAALALWHAAQRYDPCRGQFISLVSTTVRRVIINRVRREAASNPLAFQARKPRSSEVDVVEVDQVADDKPGPFECAAGADERVHLSAQLTRLDRRSLELLVRHIGEGESFTAIGFDHGLSRARVRQIVAAAIERLRERGSHR